MKIGQTYEKAFTPTSQHSAAAVGSGTLVVLSTPSLLASLENVAMNCVANDLEDGLTTVGTLANIKHLKASSIGQTYTAKAELIEIDRRRLVFRVWATDAQGNLLAEGIHERFVVDILKFVGKLT